MNRKKIFIMCSILILVLLIPIITTATIKILKYDKDGRVIVSSPEELKELENGTKFTAAIHMDNNDNNEKMIEEKKQLEKQVEDMNNGKIPMSISENNNVDSVNGAQIHEDEELNNKIIQFKEVLKKYYGVEYCESLFSNIEKEMNEMSGDYKIPESSKTLLSISIDLLNRSDITDDEKEIVKYYLEEIDTSFIEDTNLLESLKNAGITID